MSVGEARALTKVRARRIQAYQTHITADRGVWSGREDEVSLSGSSLQYTETGRGVPVATLKECREIDRIDGFSVVIQGADLTFSDRILDEARVTHYFKGTNVPV